jgi:LAO/AO transport system kinase
MNLDPGAKMAKRLYEGIAKKSRPHLARAISLVEDGAGEAVHLLAEVYKHRGQASIIGITGSPGVGKSTVVDGLVTALRAIGRSVGVIAVDPSSPFTGGAILGDRVRMRSHTLDKEVFFRSLATRGHLGGVSRHTGDVIALMDAFGFDDIVVETVGAGQSEVDIMKYAETVIVVMAPNLGDDVQAIKAGILEIGDVFCINKADLPGVEKTRREIEMMLNLRDPNERRPQVVLTQASEGKGIDALLAALQDHREYLVSSGLLKEKVRAGNRAVLEEYLRHLTVEKVIARAEADGGLEDALTELGEGKLDPLTCASNLIKRYLLD